MANLTPSEQCIEDIRKAADRVCSETNQLRDSMIARVQLEGANGICIGDGKMGIKESDGGDRLVFQPGDINRQKIQALLGRLEANGDMVKDAKLWKISSFQFATRAVEVLEATSNERAWLCSSQTGLCLVGRNGNTVTKRNINRVPEAIAMSDSGDIYFTSYRDMSVKKMDTSGRIGHVVNTSPLHPLGLCFTNAEDLLICVVDKFDFVTGKDKPKDILKVKLDNGVATSVKFLGGDEKLTGPYRVLENINGDIVLIDGLSETSGRIVVLYGTGGVKFTYTGKDAGDVFCPTHVSIDYNGNIFVLDGESNSIHVLNSAGTLQRKIVLDVMGRSVPNILSIGRDGYMWVGYSYGEVVVYRYGRTNRVMSRKINEKETYF